MPSLEHEVLTVESYGFEDLQTAIDPISGERPRKLRYGVDGAWKESKSTCYMPCCDPSTGAVIALAPQCTAEEVEECIQSAVRAYPQWRDTPITKRVQVLFRMKALLDEHLDELTHLCARENGKKWMRPGATSSRSSRSWNLLAPHPR